MQSEVDKIFLGVSYPTPFGDTFLDVFFLA